MAEAYSEFETMMRRGGSVALAAAGRFFERDDPVFKTLSGITSKLEQLAIPYAVAGGMALVAHGYDRTTVGVDILVTPVSFAVGKQVTTIEGLPAVWAEQKHLPASDSANALHPVQQAWIDEQVPQCGYCQSGMMIAAMGLLAKNKNPTVADIKDAFTNTPPSPHLCRCGTYAAIIDAVQRAAKAMHAGKE